MITRRIFSGIQPTGVPHIGNYLGAIKNWVKLQNEKQNELVMFCIVDLHSTTTSYDPAIRRENIFQMLASLLACGIKPEKSLIFQQSRVPHHTELAWLLSCLAPTGKLKRMHQWKTKSSKEKEFSNLGLFSYPVLMASDILLYKSTHVPVGDDQLQHIELTRDLTVEFNKKYSQTFQLPQPISTDTPRIMNLRKPLDKMSKSEKDINSRIDLIDSNDEIMRKIRKAVTDSEDFIHTIDKRPGVKNLLSIYSAFSGMNFEEVRNKYEDIQYFTLPLKNDLIGIITNHLQPIREKYSELLDDRNYLEKVLIDGSEKANEIAEETMKDIYFKVGMR